MVPLSSQSHWSPGGIRYVELCLALAIEKCRILPQREDSVQCARESSNTKSESRILSEVKTVIALSLSKFILGFQYKLAV